MKMPITFSFKKTAAIFLTAFLFTIHLPCLAENNLRHMDLLRETQLAVEGSKVVISSVFSLPNDSLIMHYYIPLEQPKELCNEMLTCFSYDGRLLWSRRMGAKAWDDTESGYVQWNVFNDRIEEEHYSDSEMDTVTTHILDFNGETLQPALEIKYQTDEEKNYTTELYPFIVKQYPFGEPELLCRTEILNAESNSTAEAFIPYGEFAFSVCNDEAAISALDSQGICCCSIFDRNCRLLKSINYPDNVEKVYSISLQAQGDFVSVVKYKEDTSQYLLWCDSNGKFEAEKYMLANGKDAVLFSDPYAAVFSEKEYLFIDNQGSMFELTPCGSVICSFAENVSGCITTIEYEAPTDTYWLRNYGMMPS